eukprot:6205341-Pleurochrysis_carterae.AAC.1
MSVRFESWVSEIPEASDEGRHFHSRSWWVHALEGSVFRSKGGLLDVGWTERFRSLSLQSALPGIVHRLHSPVFAEVWARARARP